MLRLMHVHAHPDDESSKGAATHRQVRRRGRRRARRHLHRRRARLDPEPEDGPPRRAGEHHRDPPRRRWTRAREILGVRQDWLGFVDSGWPEGDPQPPLPEGCFGLVPVEEAAEPLVRLIRGVPAARDDDVRRERRLPAPRPHHVPQGQRGGVRGGRRPGRATPTPASRGSR